jgi:hypothetical protein
LLVSVNSLFIVANHHAYIDAILPNGIIEIVGPYDYASGKFYAQLGDTDDMLTYSGLLYLQFVFCELKNDGVTRTNKRKTKTVRVLVKDSV